MQRQKTTLRIAVLFLATILVMVSMPATALAIAADAPFEAVTIDGEEYVSQIFEMKEVYDNPGHDVNYATKCLMERFDTSNAYDFHIAVVSGTAKPFCTSCDTAMKGHTSNIVIVGNQEN